MIVDPPPPSHAPHMDSPAPSPGSVEDALSMLDPEPLMTDPQLMVEEDDIVTVFCATFGIPHLTTIHHFRA